MAIGPGSAVIGYVSDSPERGKVLGRGVEEPFVIVWRWGADRAGRCGAGAGPLTGQGEDPVAAGDRPRTTGALPGLAGRAYVDHDTEERPKEG